MVKCLGALLLLGLALACGGGGGKASAALQPPTPAGYYGSQINADDIANIVVGYNPLNDDLNRTTSYRLLATHTGALNAIRTFFIWSSVKPGYNLGTGGIIQVQVETDDGTSNHGPSGTVLSTLVYANPVPPYHTNNWPLLTFANPAMLTAGSLYHIVFSNIDPNPTLNWVSLDCLWMYDGTAQVQPTVANTNLGIMEKNEAGAWIPYVRGTGTTITPVIELDYADGFAQGQGYIQGYGAPDPTDFVNPKPIDGVMGVREVFTVSGSNRTVSAVSARVNRVSGSSPLTMGVLASDGTTVLASGSTSSVPEGGAPTATFNGSSWNTVTFAAPVTLQAGSTYYLLLSTTPGTVYTTHCLAKGTTYGFLPATVFPDGYCQFNNGVDGWVGWDLWGIPRRKDCDLQFYFLVQ